MVKRRGVFINKFARGSILHGEKAYNQDSLDHIRPQHSKKKSESYALCNVYYHKESSKR